MRMYQALVAVALLLSAPAGAQALGAPPPPPAGRLFGSVTVNGSPAAPGTAVTVNAANGATCGTTAVGAAPASGSKYVVDLTGIDQGCTTVGGPLSFTVGSTSATPASPAAVPEF